MTTADELTALQTAIRMAAANVDDAAYVRRRLDEITWGVDVLLAEREKLIAVAQNARLVAQHLDDIKYLPSVLRDKNNDLRDVLAALDTSA